MTLRNYWIQAVGIFFGMMGICWVAMGATYNTYFNNVEQGPNSVANPVLNVPASGGAPAAAAPSIAEAKPVLTSQAVANAQLVQEGVSTAGPFRFSASAVSLTQKDSGHGAIAGFSYFPAKEVGFRVFAGAVSRVPGRFGFDRFLVGGDLEIVPIRLSVGRVEDLLEVGGLIGGTNVDAPNSRFSAHLGLKANVRVGEKFDVSASVRRGFGLPGRSDYWTGDAGITLRM